MTHPAFAPLSLDMQLAKSCSEIFTGDYHFIQGVASKEYGQGAELLTNPDVQLLLTHVSYMEESPTGGLRNPLKLAILKSELPPQARVADYYANSVGIAQALGTKPPIVGVMQGIKQFDGWEDVSRWYGAEVARQGRSLLSAYFLGRVVCGEDKLVEMLAYPEHIRQSLRLLIRDMLIGTLPQYPPKFQATMRDELLDNEHLYTAVATSCAAGQLLSPKGFREYINELY